MQWAEVGSLESELDHHDVATDVEVVKLAVHVREGSRVVLHLLGESVRAAEDNSDGVVGERAIVSESLYPPLEVFVLSDLVGLPDDLLVVHAHSRSPFLRPASASILLLFLQQAFIEDDLDDRRDRLLAGPLALQFTGERDPADRLSAGLDHPLEAGPVGLGWGARHR